MRGDKFPPQSVYLQAGIGPVGDDQVMVVRVVPGDAVGRRELAVLRGIFRLAAEDPDPLLPGDIGGRDEIGAVAVGHEQSLLNQGRSGGRKGELLVPVLLEFGPGQDEIQVARQVNHRHQGIGVGWQEQAPIITDGADDRAVEIHRLELFRQPDQFLGFQIGVNPQNAAIRYPEVQLAETGARIGCKTAVQVHLVVSGLFGENGQV